MSNPERSGGTTDEPPEEQVQGPSLKLLYSLIALALAVAIALAALIVLPFYMRR